MVSRNLTDERPFRTMEKKKFVDVAGDFEQSGRLQQQQQQGGFNHADRYGRGRGY